MCVPEVASQLSSAALHQSISVREWAGWMLRLEGSGGTQEPPVCSLSSAGPFAAAGGLIGDGGPGGLGL